MSEDKKTTTSPSVSPKSSAGVTVAKDIYGDKKKTFRGGPRRGAPRRGNDPRDEFSQKILEIARVTRVMAGGKRMNFRACVAVGDKKGSVGVGLGKGSDVTIAINKAVNVAKKNMIKVPIVNETIPHEVRHKLGAAKIMLKPAKQGRGVISGGVVRGILELAGINNVTSKTLGTSNKINNARCTIAALATLRDPKTKQGQQLGKKGVDTKGREETVAKDDSGEDKK